MGGQTQGSLVSHPMAVIEESGREPVGSIPEKNEKQFNKDYLKRENGSESKDSLMRLCKKSGGLRVEKQLRKTYL